MPSPSPSPNIDPESMASAFQEAMQAAYDRYLQGMKAVAASFEVPVGQTPKETIWTLNKARLYRYRPVQPPEAAQPRPAIPVLLVYALINKPYIFDLRPGQSFVEFLLQQGFDVYLLDWGVPGPEDKHIRFDDYATEYIPRAVRKMRRVSGADEFTLLGYCIGATLSTVYAALHPDAPIRNLVLLTAPLDFSAGDSIFAAWLNERYFDVDKIVDRLGNIPVELVETAAKLLKPVENYVGAYSTLWDRLDNDEAVESWQAMHKWTHDGVPFAGEAFRQWVKDYIRANKLVKGEHVVHGRRVDLAGIRASLLNVIAQYDHIVPPSHSTTIMELVSSQDKQMEIIPAGHVGVMAGRGARYKLWPKIADWLSQRSGPAR